MNVVPSVQTAGNNAVHPIRLTVGEHDFAWRIIHVILHIFRNSRVADSGVGGIAGNESLGDGRVTHQIIAAGNSGLIRCSPDVLESKPVADFVGEYTAVGYSAGSDASDHGVDGDNHICTRLNRSSG